MIKDEYDDDDLSNLGSSSRDHFISAENSPISGFDNGSFGDHFLLDSLPGAEESRSLRSFVEPGKIEHDQEDEEEEVGSEDASGIISGTE